MDTTLHTVEQILQHLQSDTLMQADTPHPAFRNPPRILDIGSSGFHGVRKKSDTNFTNYREKLMKIRENSGNSWQKFSQPHEFPKSLDIRQTLVRKTWPG